MISLSDFFTVPPVRLVSCVVRDLETNPGGTLLCGPTRPAPGSAEREISCPQKGKRRVHLQGCWTVRSQRISPIGRQRCRQLKRRRSKTCGRRIVNRHHTSAESE